MPTTFLCGVRLESVMEQPAAASRVAGCFATLQRHGLEPLLFATEPWTNGTPELFGTPLLHPEFAKATGDPLWGAGFMFVPDRPADATIVTMSTPAKPLVEAWQWLLPLAEEMSDEVDADLTLINGFAVRGGRAIGGTPAGADIAPGHAPRVLTPWMYWGRSRLADAGVREALASLQTTAFRSSATPRGGWVLQPHAEYSTAQPKSLLAAYAAAFHQPPPRWLAAE